MMDHPELREMIEDASAWAEKRFAHTGAITPLWHAVTADGERFILPAPHQNKNISASI